MREENNEAIRQQMVEDNKAAEGRFQQQLAAMNTAADAQQRRWDEQKEQDRLNRERLEKQAKEQQKENDRLKKEQSKSKNFFGSALLAVCQVVGLGLNIAGFFLGIPPVVPGL
jgi:uncharacterized membrane protein YdbT with pleckstrin-like domain